MTISNKTQKLLRQNDLKKISYSDYIRGSMAEAERSYRDSLGAAMTERALTKLSSGATGERVATSGLLGSGYSDYLKQSTREKEAAGLTLALGNKYRSLGAAESSYEEYIDNYSTLQKKAGESLIASIREGGITDMDRALRLAAEGGLDYESAIYAATEGVRQSKNDRFQSIALYLKEKAYPYAQAYSYAIKKGLSPAEAKAIASTLKRATDEEISELWDMSSEEYFELIKKTYSTAK